MVIDEQPEKLKEGVQDEHFVRLKVVVLSDTHVGGGKLGCVIGPGLQGTKSSFDFFADGPSSKFSLFSPVVWSTLDTAFLCSSLIRLYDRTPSTLQWPMISCSSTPFWNRRVAHVTRREWFVLYPGMPADLHSLATVRESVLCPTGTLEYQMSPLGFRSGVR